MLVALLKAADEITRCAMLPATTNLLLARSNLTDWELEIQKVRLRAYRLERPELRVTTHACTGSGWLLKRRPTGDVVAAVVAQVRSGTVLEGRVRTQRCEATRVSGQDSHVRFGCSIYFHSSFITMMRLGDGSGRESGPMSELVDLVGL